MTKQGWRYCLTGLGVAILMALPLSKAGAQEVVHQPMEENFPISPAVQVKAGADIYFLSGKMGPTLNPTAPKGTPPDWGDTATQTENALNSIKAELATLGLTMGDVVKMTVFMAGDPAKGGKMDFAGMMSSYRKFFGTNEQPNLPTRSAVQVAALAAPKALIEIEVIAAKGH